ncbi:MAG TPA: hypothetical protein VMF59_05900 [Bacteroidota bacterium]|nr:hypothetical protein [Bacteroidota bacterium]
MKASSLVLILALAASGCSDLGVPPSAEAPRQPALRDDFIGITVIPGIHTRIYCTDSLGTTRKVFSPAEPVFMRYSVTNGTGKEQTWARAMGNPFARFFVVQGSDTLADSYEGIAFIAFPSQGTLKAGDSLVALWRFDPARIPLPPGGYSAIASSDFVLLGLGVPGDTWGEFILSL